ncbi:RNA-directed DNA polymerase, eukaryota, Reverse transcriptase zinc-binding domain protein [Artemisia annua]|uniref:RNA-directed DNA polymerase, eukaryota, Reverse transcriptase zinc-binding domain protein n=1 Tax=Artemisia annua TaxID=35608 RepID=A0A2U1LIC7_ARTAN|nr:RNA-directed DNA polymerase, eukaryota, Reverse transcriptase zinc-binding domain protein [Artemisia annua]
MRTTYVGRPKREKSGDPGLNLNDIDDVNQSPITDQGVSDNDIGTDGGNQCHNYGLENSVNVLKRKKSKQKNVEVGCVSGGHYSSSNDRPTKGFKTGGLSDDDPFNLNPFILGLDGNVLKTRGMGPVQISNSFQTLLVETEETPEENEKEVPSVAKETSPNLTSEAELRDKEMAATKEFGGRLGVDLQGFEQLVSKTIEGEGLQFGVRADGNASWCKGLISKYKVDFMGLQESILGDPDKFDFSMVWGTRDCDVDVVGARGKSGGLISIWNPRKFNILKTTLDQNFIVTTGNIIEDGSILNVVNVYAPQKVGEKRALWERLLAVMQGMLGMWIFIGDFSSVRWDCERRNSKFNNRAARDFNSFIDEACLQEFTMQGSRFTFMTGYGKDAKMSKIDRMLVCQDFFNRWHGACLRALPRELSDHSPLLLTVSDSNYGAKPFKWFNSWLDREGCEDIVRDAWNNVSFEGPADIVIFKKFVAVKLALMSWWKSFSKKEGAELEFLKNDIRRLELIMETRDLEEDELWVWEESKKELDRMVFLKNKDLKQKSRVNWASLGDENSAYFHRCINGRKAANDIPGVLVNGEWISKPPWPALFSLEKDKECSVSSRVVYDGTQYQMSSSWSSCFHTVEGISEKQDVLFMLSQVRLYDRKDRWIWDNKPAVEFSVAAVKDSIRQNLVGCSSHVNTLVWRIDKGRVPTRVELIRRNIVLPSARCPMCNSADESVSHIFFSCIFASGVWSLVWRWCKMSVASFADYEAVLKWPSSRSNSAKEKKIICGIFWVTSWAIWKERNKVVFQNGEPKVMEVVSLIKSMSFIWLKYRSKYHRIVWNDWVKYPLYML